MKLTTEQVQDALAKGEKDPRKTVEAQHMDTAVDADLFRKMRMGVDQWHPIDVIGEGNPKDFIYMRILSIGELDDIQAEALKWYSELQPFEQIPLRLIQKEARLTIKKALSSGRLGGDDYQYQANDETIEAMSLAMLRFLHNKYEEINLKYNPNLDTLTDDEYSQYLEELKKKVSLVKDLSRPRLESIFIRLFNDAISLKDNIHTLFSQEPT